MTFGHLEQELCANVRTATCLIPVLIDVALN